MRVNEIVREERIDEALPLLGLGAIPMILSAVAFGMKAMSIYDLYDNLSKNGFDIDNMSDDDKLKLFVDFIILFVPGGGRFANATIMRLMPDWLKRKGIKMVGDHLKTKAEELRKMKNANRKKYADKPGTSPAQSAKNQKQLSKANKKLDSEYQAVGKQLAAEKLKDVAYTVVGGLALLPLTYTYYGKLDELDKQYTAHKGGDTTTELFGTMDASAAYKQYSALRNKYIGELTIGVAAALSRTPVMKLAEGFTKLVGKTPLVGGIIKLPLALATRVAKVGGPALAVLMQTDEGQKFLSNAIVEVITRGVGALTATTVNLLAKALDAALGAVGINTNFGQATAAQKPPPGTDTSAQNKSDIYGLSIHSDPKNPNIKYIGGQQVTTPDGYLKNNIANVLKVIRDKARDLKVSNPIDQLKQNPSLQYPTY